MVAELIGRKTVAKLIREADLLELRVVPAELEL
jgi:hypothetical protein